MSDVSVVQSNSSPDDVPKTVRRSGAEAGLDKQKTGELQAGRSLHFDFSDWGNCGMTLHFFSMGFVVGGLDAILFNVLEGYLNEPSDIMKGAQNVATLPVMFSVFLGILSDSRPVFGYRRRPYMVGGWMLAATSFIILLSLGLPAPYYCFSAVDRHYLMDEAPCNPEAVDCNIMSIRTYTFMYTYTHLYTHTHIYIYVYVYKILFTCIRAKPEAVDFYSPIVICLCFAMLGCTAATSAAEGLLVEYATYWSFVAF